MDRLRGWIKRIKEETFTELFRIILRKISSSKPRESTYLPILRKDFTHLELGSYCIQKLIDDYEFKSILDIGVGEGLHSEIFIKNNKKVTAIDYGDSIYFKENKPPQGSASIMAITATYCLLKTENLEKVEVFNK